MNCITKYQAFDGTMFDDEEECQKHEDQIFFDSLEGLVEFRNKDGERMTLEKYSMVDILDECKYIFFKDKTGWNKLIDVADFFEYNSLPFYGNCYASGAWFYDDDQGDWISIESLAQKINEIEAIFSK